MRHAFSKRAALAGAALIVSSISAQAADQSYVKPFKPLPAVSGFDWTGAYVGGTIGYAWGKTGEADVSGTSSGNPIVGPLADIITDGTAQSLRGMIGGVFAGANWQKDNFVFGLEAGFDLNDVKSEEVFVTPAPSPSTVTASIRSDWTATMGPRVGVAADRALFFAEGGLAISRATVGVDIAGGPASLSLEDSRTHYGYYLGVGTDFAVTDSVFLGVKYNYVDLQDQTFSFSDAASSTSITATGDAHYHTGKLRLGIKF